VKHLVRGEVENRGSCNITISPKLWCKKKNNTPFLYKIQQTTYPKRNQAEHPKKKTLPKKTPISYNCSYIIANKP
jgi:hypothetical protein